MKYFVDKYVTKRIYVEHFIKDTNTLLVIGSLFRHSRWEKAPNVALRSALAERRIDDYQHL